MDYERCLDLLWVYRVGTKMLRLIKTLWNQSILACCVCGNYGRVFQAERDVMQGGPLLPKLFNVLVDAIVQEWLRKMFGYYNKPP